MLQNPTAQKLFKLDHIPSNVDWSAPDINLCAIVLYVRVSVKT